MKNRLKGYLRVVYSGLSDYFYFYARKYGFVNSFIIATIISSVVIFLDYNNYLSKFTMLIDFNTFKTVSLLTIFFFVLFLIKIRFFRMLVHPLLNKIDQMILIGILSIFIWLLFTLTNYSNLTTKFLYAKFAGCILIGLFILRFFFRGEKSTSKKSVIVDLKEILDGSVNYEKPFLVRESAVDYDLLNRNRLINDLVGLIKGYISEERFVIGIEGKWGSGKTTVLKNLIFSLNNQDDMIVIDDFEPWLSESKESLLRNLLKKILRQSNLEIPDKEIDMLISSIIKNVLGTGYVNPVMDLIDNSNDEKVALILNDINYMICRNNKKIIFTIDNLDRLAPENVFLILNIVNNILDFSNLIVIMSYDKDEIDKGLESINVSPAYLNKLVQKKVILPLANEEDLLNIYYNSLISLLDGKHIKYEDAEVAEFAKIFSNNQIGLREFKNFLNSTVIPFINNSKKISLIDYLAIEYIRSYDYPMFDLIYTQRNYFISIDQPINVLFTFLDENSYDNNMNDFFDKIIFNSNVTKELMLLIFPNLKVYFESKKNYRYAVSTKRNDSGYRQIQKDKKICSGKFFDLYFTQENNFDSVIIDYISMLICDLNNPNKDLLYVRDKYKDLVNLSPEKSALFFTTLSLYTDELLPKGQEVLARYLIELHMDFGNYSAFFSLGTQDRIALIISELLRSLDYNSSIIITKELIQSPKNLSFISKVIYWLKKDIEFDDSRLVDYLNQNFDNLIAEVLDGKFNLFDKDLYSKGNSFSLLRWLREEGKTENFKKYVEEKISEENIYRVLNDFVASGSGTMGYTYQLIDNFQDYVNSSTLEKFLMQHSPKNEKQQFLKKVFDNHLKGKADIYGDISIKRDTPIDLVNVD